MRNNGVCKKSGASSGEISLDQERGLEEFLRQKPKSTRFYVVENPIQQTWNRGT